MTAKTEPRSGLRYGWDLGDGPWKDEKDADILWMGRVGMHLSVLDRNLTAPPATPADGDTYIVAATASDAWLGQEDKVAVWDATAAAWVFYQARIGWIAYIEDEQVLSAFKAAGWSAGVAI
jgi:hypothetical protein